MADIIDNTYTQEQITAAQEAVEKISLDNNMTDKNEIDLIASLETLDPDALSYVLLTTPLKIPGLATGETMLFQDMLSAIYDNTEQKGKTWKISAKADAPQWIKDICTNPKNNDFAAFIQNAMRCLIGEKEVHRGYSTTKGVDFTKDAIFGNQTRHAIKHLMTTWAPRIYGSDIKALDANNPRPMMEYQKYYEDGLEGNKERWKDMIGVGGVLEGVLTETAGTYKIDEAKIKEIKDHKRRDCLTKLVSSDFAGTSEGFEVDGSGYIKSKDKQTALGLWNGNICLCKFNADRGPSGSATEFTGKKVEYFLDGGKFEGDSEIGSPNNTICNGLGTYTAPGGNYFIQGTREGNKIVQIGNQEIALVNRKSPGELSKMTPKQFADRKTKIEGVAMVPVLGDVPMVTPGTDLEFDATTKPKSIATVVFPSGSTDNKVMIGTQEVNQPGVDIGNYRFSLDPSGQLYASPKDIQVVDLAQEIKITSSCKVGGVPKIGPETTLHVKKKVEAVLVTGSFTETTKSESLYTGITAVDLMEGTTKKGEVVWMTKDAIKGAKYMTKDSHKGVFTSNGVDYTKTTLTGKKTLLAYAGPMYAKDGKQTPEGSSFVGGKQCGIPGNFGRGFVEVTANGIQIKEFSTLGNTSNITGFQTKAPYLNGQFTALKSDPDATSMKFRYLLEKNDGTVGVVTFETMTAQASSEALQKIPNLKNALQIDAGAEADMHILGSDGKTRSTLGKDELNKPKSNVIAFFGG